MQQVISRNTWHYRYHCNLKSWYGLKVKEETSLCPYFHFTFWGSAVTAILALPAALGWVLTKVYRLLYFLAYYSAWGENLMTKIESKLAIGRGIDKLVKATQDNPVPVYLTVAVISVIFLGLLWFCCMSIFFAIVCIPKVPLFVWACIKGVGIGLFYAVFGFKWAVLAVGWFFAVALGTFGVICQSVVDCFAWLFSAASIPFLLIAGKWVMIGLSVSVVSVAITYLTILFFKSEFFSKHIAMRASNTYGRLLESREKTAKIRKYNEEQKLLTQSDEEEQEADEGPGLLSQLFSPLGNGFFLITNKTIGSFIHLYKKQIGSRIKKVGSEKVKVMGGVTVAWEMAKAAKQGICPTLRFVDEEELQEIKKEKKQLALQNI
jgi:hypothetical protein